jgi:hypothetical protein
LFHFASIGTIWEYSSSTNKEVKATSEGQTFFPEPITAGNYKGDHGNENKILFQSHFQNLETPNLLSTPSLSSSNSETLEKTTEWSASGELTK